MQLPAPFQQGLWRLCEADEGAAEALAESLELSPVTGRILAARGIREASAAARFLSPSLADLPDPFELDGMEAAVERIEHALRRGEPIALFGDYDVDGVTATALLCDFLGACGERPAAWLPHRSGSGYGLSAEAVEEIAASGAKLLITVDNGQRAFEAAERAAKLGLDLIVTDHHEVGERLPRACAVVNPRRQDPAGAMASLSGCGVAFMLALALRRRLRDALMLPAPEPNLREQLDLVALGTIADVVPLTGASRVLARFGLAQLSRTNRFGLRALLALSGTAPADVTPTAVAFRLAPRINGAGRVGSARLALDLLFTRDEAEATRMAQELDAANRERQRVEEEALREAEAMLRADPTTSEAPAIVVHSEAWHVGVIGIVASRLAERNGRPAVVITRSTEPARGSARSASGVNLLEALSECDAWLLRHGGHAMAAGLTIDAARIDGFSRRFAQACAERGADSRPRLEVDAVVSASDITPSLVAEVGRLEPFGIGNPEPVLALSEAQIADRRPVGSGHVKLRLEAEGVFFDAIGFSMAERVDAGIRRASVAFTPQFNTWNGCTSVQLKLRDLVAL